jgi:hypothetical protein
VVLHEGEPTRPVILRPLEDIRSHLAISPDGRWVAFVATLALLLNVQVVFHSNLLFADMPFALVTVLFVLCNRRSSNRIHGVLAAVCAVAAFLLRAAGVALFAAWVVESLARKQFKTAAVRLLISAIPVLGWQAYVFQVQGSASYATPAYPYQRAPYLFNNVSYAENLSLVDMYRPDSGRIVIDRISWAWKSGCGRPAPSDSRTGDTHPWKHRTFESGSCASLRKRVGRRRNAARAPTRPRLRTTRF